jgi:ketosteroid isomerase-like protein
MAMSHENVELVKKFIAPAETDYRVLFGDDVVWSAAKERGEALVAPDFEGAFIMWGQSTAFRGLDGLREAFLDWIAPWTTYYNEIEEVRPVGDDRVVVLGREHGHRLDTEAEVEAESAGIYFLRDGKIARVDYYAKRSEALEAVGLAERDVQADLS